MSRPPLPTPPENRVPTLRLVKQWKVAIGSPEWEMTTRMRTRACRAEALIEKMLQELEDVYNTEAGRADLHDSLGHLIDVWSHTVESWNE